MAGFEVTAVDQLGELPVIGGMRAVVVVERDVKVAEVGAVFTAHALDEQFGGDALLLRAQHDGRAVRVVGAHIHAVMPAQLLESHPDVGLDVLDQVSHMDRPIGIGQGAGDQQGALLEIHRVVSR